MYYRLKCFTFSAVMFFVTFPIVAALGAREREQRLDTTKLEAAPDTTLDKSQLYQVSQKQLNTSQFITKFTDGLSTGKSRQFCLIICL